MNAKEYFKIYSPNSESKNIQEMMIDFAESYHDFKGNRENAYEFDRIAKIVSNYYGVDYEAVLGDKRNETIVLARHVIFHLLISLGRWRKPTIEKFFNRKRALVEYANRKVNGLLEVDKKFQKEYEEIKGLI